MKKKYVIYSLIEGGYWDENYPSFRGWIFATLYDSPDDKRIMKQLELCTKSSKPIEIKEIYFKQF